MARVAGPVILEFLLPSVCVGELSVMFSSSLVGYSTFSTGGFVCIVVGCDGTLYPFSRSSDLNLCKVGPGSLHHASCESSRR